LARLAIAVENLTIGVVSTRSLGRIGEIAVSLIGNEFLLLLGLLLQRLLTARHSTGAPSALVGRLLTTRCLTLVANLTVRPKPIWDSSKVRMLGTSVTCRLGASASMTVFRCMMSGNCSACVSSSSNSVCYFIFSDVS
jgi:hypothetical protein